MDYEKLAKIREAESQGIKYCIICGTPFKPYNSRQKVCGNPRCRKKNDSIYSAKYRQSKMTKEQRNATARRYRAKQKEKKNFEKNLDQMQDKVNKQLDFDERVKKYGLNWGEYQAKKILEKVPKIDVSMDAFTKKGDKNVKKSDKG